MNIEVPPFQEIHVEASHEAISTLDEPVLDTLLRDARGVGRKMLVVVWPSMGNDRELRDWDLWGPLVLCLVLASILAANAQSDQAGLIFSAVFLLVWLGGIVVTLNAKFLGSKLSFFQTICVMGYSTAPICVGAIFAVFVPVWLRAIICLVAWGWSCWASLRFFRGTTRPDRELLVLYPVTLFFFFMTWMVVVGVGK